MVFRWRNMLARSEAEALLLNTAQKQASKQFDEIIRLRMALRTIVANTEPDAIRHRDYDHLAKDICDCANTALKVGE